MLGAWLLAVALAADPVVTQEADSWVVAHVDIAAPPAAVFAVVSDPAAVARIDGSTTVETTPDGPCTLADNHVEHPLASASYRTRSCTEGDTVVRATLVSGAMKSFDAVFQLEPIDGGTRLNYRIRTIPALPVPQFLVDRATVRGADRMLRSLRDALERPPAAP